MEYQIIGRARQPITGDNGKTYMPISVINPMVDKDWLGVNAECLWLLKEDMDAATNETENGDIFARDNREYWVDIDYNRRGKIIRMRFYNKPKR